MNRAWAAGLLCHVVLLGWAVFHAYGKAQEPPLIQAEPIKDVELQRVRCSLSNFTGNLEHVFAIQVNAVGDGLPQYRAKVTTSSHMAEVCDSDPCTMFAVHGHFSRADKARAFIEMASDKDRYDLRHEKYVCDVIVGRKHKYSDASVNSEPAEKITCIAKLGGAKTNLSIRMKEKDGNDLRFIPPNETDHGQYNYTNISSMVVLYSWTKRKDFSMLTLIVPKTFNKTCGSLVCEAQPHAGAAYWSKQILEKCETTADPPSEEGQAANKTLKQPHSSPIGAQKLFTGLSVEFDVLALVIIVIVTCIVLGIYCKRRSSHRQQENVEAGERMIVQNNTNAVKELEDL